MAEVLLIVGAGTLVTVALHPFTLHAMRGGAKSEAQQRIAAMKGKSDPNIMGNNSPKQKRSSLKKKLQVFFKDPKSVLRTKKPRIGTISRESSNGSMASTFRCSTIEESQEEDDDIPRL